MKKIITEIAIRIKSESPAFFNKLKYLGTSLAAVGASFQAIPHAPEKIVTLGIHLIIAGGVMAAVSQLTVKSPDQV